MKEEILFQDRVRERDLDNFLVEELHSSETFRNWLLARLSRSFEPPQIGFVRLGKSPQRLQDNRQTDVRMGWFDEEERLLACVLIESKVTADFQQGQAEAYAAELAQCRDVLGERAASAILVAPEAKLLGLVGRELFDDCVALEEITDFLQARTEKETMAPELARRLETRIGLLQALCGKRNGGSWSPITIPEKRAFSDLYEQLAAEVVPALTVRASTDGPKAITKFFEGARLPSNFPAVSIKHEFGSAVHTKYANIQFAGLSGARDLLTDSGLLGESGFSLETSRTALFVRKATPGIDPTAAFETQRERVLEGLYAVRDLTEWLEHSASGIMKVLEPALPATSAPVGLDKHLKNERDLKDALFDIYYKCDALGYRPTGMLDLVKDHGAIGTVKRLIANPISDGFARLALLGRLDLAVESLALQERWSELFTDEELLTCRRRLR